MGGCVLYVNVTGVETTESMAKFEHHRLTRTRTRPPRSLACDSYKNLHTSVPCRQITDNWRIPVHNVINTTRIEVAKRLEFSTHHSVFVCLSGE